MSPRTAALPRAVVALGLLAVALAALPYIAGFLAAPHGLVFLGALNNLGDTGQYLAALRQGAEGHLLYTNQYTSLHVAAVLMYPLYTATGLLLSPFHLPPMAAYHLLHLLAGVALLAALWRFCVIAQPGRPVLGYAIALFGGGLYLPVLLLSGLVRLPFAPAALTAPELSVFATLLISPHGAMGLAAELWALGSYVCWRRDGGSVHLLTLALGGLALGLCYPFGLPVLLAVVGVDAVAHVVWPDSETPWPAMGDARKRVLTTTDGAAPATSEDTQPNVVQRIWGTLVVAPALLPALAVALYYAVLFRHDPLWGASNLLRLPPPSPAVLAAAYGPLLGLALAAVLGGRRWAGAARLYGRGGPAGRLVLTWAAVNGLLLLLPLPQPERLLSGWSVPLALLAATALASGPDGGRRSRERRWASALSLSNVTLALLYLLLTATAGNPAYYEPAGEAAAVGWLAAHCGPDDVVMASAGSGNAIVSAARCRVVVGQNFETFNWAQAQRDVLAYYATTTAAGVRAAILRRHGVTLVLAGPYERALGRFVPPVGYGYRLLYTGGAVRVFAVEGR